MNSWNIANFCWVWSKGFSFILRIVATIWVVKATCEGVASFVGKVLHSIHHCVFGGEGIEVPLNAGVSTVLSQAWMVHMKEKKSLITNIIIISSVCQLSWESSEDVRDAVKLWVFAPYLPCIWFADQWVSISAPNPPIRVLLMSTSKAVTKLSRKFLTRRKLSLPMLHEPSTRMTMSAIDEVVHTNWSAMVKGQKHRQKQWLNNFKFLQVLDTLKWTIKVIWCAGLVHSISKHQYAANSHHLLWKKNLTADSYHKQQKK